MWQHADICLWETEKYGGDHTIYSQVCMIRTEGQHFTGGREVRKGCWVQHEVWAMWQQYVIVGRLGVKF